MRTHCLVATAFAALFLGACGGGGDAAPKQGIDFGLVSATDVTLRTVPVTNPLTQPARVRWLSWNGPFTTNRTLLPTAPLPPGGSFDMDVTLTPGAPGPVEGDVTLEFVGADRTTPVVVRMFATVEEPRVFSSPSALEFGPVAFGASLERTLTITNPSSVSTLRYTGLSAPTSDLQIIEPTLPFEVSPRGSRTVRLRMSPYRSLADLDSVCSVTSAGPWGAVSFTARCQPGPGRMVMDLGTFALSDDKTPILSVFVPAHVWSFHVAAWRPGAVLPAYEYNGFGEPDYAPLGTSQHVVPLLYEGPAGEDLRPPPAPSPTDTSWRNTNGTFADTLPRCWEAAGRLPAGGGTYRVQFAVNDDPPADATLVVRVVLKASQGGVPPPAGTLDLNVWLGDLTGVTATTAAQDAALQAGLAGAQQILLGQGVTLGDIDYYSFLEFRGGNPTEDVYSSIRAALPREPGLVEERLNLFVHSRGDQGAAARIQVPFCAHTNHSWAHASLVSVYFAPMAAHEMLHCLGLPHVPDDRNPDTVPGALPTNIMELLSGTALTPQQGLVIRAHPFVR